MRKRACQLEVQQLKTLSTLIMSITYISVDKKASLGGDKHRECNNICFMVKLLINTVKHLKTR